MMTCKEVAERSSDYLDGRFSMWERVHFRMHLMMCKVCPKFLEQMKAAILAARNITIDPAPASVEKAALDHFRKWKP